MDWFWYRITAMSCAFAMAVVLLWTWFIAYFNPCKCVTIFVNAYGEGLFELFFIPVIVLFSGIVLLHWVVKG